MRKLAATGHLKVLPGVLVIVGDTMEEAQAKRAKLDSLVHTDSALPNLSMRLGTDASKFDLDAPLPPIPETNAGKSGRQAAIDLAAREGLTVRQLAQRGAGYGGLTMVGTAATIADQMEEWLITDACDGFNVMFPFLPAGLDDFVDKVVPELSAAACFDWSMRARHYGRILACRGRQPILRAASGGGIAFRPEFRNDFALKKA